MSQRQMQRKKAKVKSPFLKYFNPHWVGNQKNY